MTFGAIEELERYDNSTRLGRRGEVGQLIIQTRAVLEGVVGESLILDPYGVSEQVTVTAQNNLSLTLSAPLASNHEAGVLVLRDMPGVSPVMGRLSAAASGGAVTVSSTAEGRVGSWAVIGAWKANCETRKITAIGSGWTISPALDNAHTAGERVLVIDELDVNVRWYGAVGNGTANDTTAMQAALDDVNDLAGGVVTVPAGSYLITTKLSVYAYTTLQGDGFASQIVAGGAINMVEVPTVGSSSGRRYINIRNLRLTGGNLASCGIYMYLAILAHVQDVVIADVSGPAITLNETQNSLFENVLTTGCIDGLQVINSAAGNLFHKCHFTNNSRYHLYSDEAVPIHADLGDGKPNANRWVGCYFEHGAPTLAVYVKEGSRQSMRDCHVTQGTGVNTNPVLYAGGSLNQYSQMRFNASSKGSEGGILSYTGGLGTETFTDDGRDFQDFSSAAPGTAQFLIYVTNGDATAAWGYLGPDIAGTEVEIYSDSTLTTRGWLGTASGKTPASYDIYTVGPLVDVRGSFNEFQLCSVMAFKGPVVAFSSTVLVHLVRNFIAEGGLIKNASGNAGDHLAVQWLVSHGQTADQPSQGEAYGGWFWNRELGKPQWYNNTTWLDAIAGRLWLPQTSTLTPPFVITGGVLPNSSRVTNILLSSETGVTDDLDEVTGASLGDVLLLRAANGHTITVRHSVGSNGAFSLPFGLPVQVVYPYDALMFVWGSDSKWHLIGKPPRVWVIATSTTPHTAGGEDVILMDASGGAKTINLPAVSGRDGKQYVIKKTDVSANAVTLDGNASEAIDGSATYVISAALGAVTIVCSGTGWVVV